MRSKISLIQKFPIDWCGFFIQDHVRTCLHQPVPCPNSGCDKSIAANRKDIHAKEECEYRPELCQYCNNYVPWKLMQVLLYIC